MNRKSFLRHVGLAIAAAGGAGAAAVVTERWHTATVADQQAESGVIRLADFCAEDGRTDDAPRIQAAVDELVAHGGGVLQFSPGASYYWDTDVLVDAPGVTISLLMTGAVIVVGPNAVNVLTVTGTRQQIGGDDAYAPTSVGDMAISPFADAADLLSVGDSIMLWSSDVDNAERPSHYRSGEEAVVTAVSAQRVELDRPLRLTHGPDAARRLFRFALAQRPVVEGASFELHPQGLRQVAVAIRYAQGPRVDDVTVRGSAGRYGVHIDQCLEPAVNRVTGVDIYDGAHGTAPNGVAVYCNGVIGATVTDVTGERCRHAVDVNSYSSQTRPGLVSRDVVITAVHAIGTYGPGWTTHHVRGAVFDSPVSQDCGGGAQLRGYDVTLLRPVVRGGNQTKPPEWNTTRYVPAGIVLGETKALPPGEGIAAEKVLIEYPVFEALPQGWTPIAYSDRPGDVTIVGD